MHSLLMMSALLCSGPVYTEPGEIPRLQIVTDQKTELLPLQYTHVKASILGYTARVEVTQRYMNPSDHPIEAIYVFPLPENSAVDDMKIVIGSRIIQAEIQKRADARRTYDAGVYEFVFPMVVGPRFSPPGVVDVARITPPYMGNGERSGHDISIEVTANAGLPIKHWDAPTHETVMTPTFDGCLKLALSPKDNLPNRDFVLHYSVDGKESLATVLGERDSIGGFLTLIVQPPKLDVDKLVGSREIEDVKIDWNGLAVSEVYPSRVPDLFASRPLTVHARTSGSGKHKIFINGTSGGRAFSLPVDVEISGEMKEKSALATLWARSKITDLERNLWNGDDATTANAITELGLSHRLVTAYTSFVAVDPNSKVDGRLQTIVQPIDAPEGVNMLQASAKVSQRSFGLAGTGVGGGGMGIGSASGKVARGVSVESEVKSAPMPMKAERQKTQASPASLLIQTHASEVSALAAKTLGTTTLTITLTYFVSADGKILQPKLTLSSGPNKAFEAELLKLLKTWTLPAASGAQTYTFRVPS